MATDAEVDKVRKEIAKLEDQRREAEAAHRQSTDEASNDILLAQLNTDRDRLAEELKQFKELASPRGVQASAQATVQQIEQGGGPPAEEPTTEDAQESVPGSSTEPARPTKEK